MNPPGKKNILVIEDNPLNLELVTDLLEAAGFAVTPARTAEEGIRLAGDLLPDLVLMDWSLPGMDGLAATRILKGDSRTSGLTILALTAHAMKGDEAVALAAGCDGYLTKPIDTRTFARRIAQFMELNRPGDAEAGAGLHPYGNRTAG